jgi:hypothetical protein
MRASWMAARSHSRAMRVSQPAKIRPPTSASEPSDVTLTLRSLKGPGTAASPSRPRARLGRVRGVASMAGKLPKGHAGLQWYARWDVLCAAVRRQ